MHVSIRVPHRDYYPERKRLSVQLYGHGRVVNRIRARAYVEWKPTRARFYMRSVTSERRARDVCIYICALGWDWRTALVLCVAFDLRGVGLVFFFVGKRRGG